MNNNDKSVSIALIESTFNELGERLAKAGRTAEIAIYGGAAMMLLFDTRDYTRDVDYVPLIGDMTLVKSIAQDVAAKNDLPPDWLNDSVKVFVSDQANHSFFGDYPRGGKAGLRVFTASPEYLFAMKCMAMRNVMETSDAQDIWNLADECNIQTCEQALEIVQEFYPNKIPRRNALILEDVFQEKAANKPFAREIFW